MKGHTITRALSALGLATVAVAVSLAQPTQLAFWDFNESDPLNGLLCWRRMEACLPRRRKSPSIWREFRFNNSGRGFLGSRFTDPGPP
jgi:hypothetical protein